MRAYDETYLKGAMEHLGDMMEYACFDCGYNPEEFFKLFLLSKESRSFQVGNPSIIAGRSGPELAYIIFDEFGIEQAYIEPSWRENRSDLYWCGYILAYFQWHENISFKKISENISMDMLRNMYSKYHEMDIEHAVDYLKKLCYSSKKRTIRMLRFARGLSQRELAYRANITVSQLQRLEYGERKFENVSLKTACALSEALGVSITEIE